MLNKATKIMSQRNDYKDELVNELNTLGFEVSTLDNLIPTNTVEETKEVAPIIINKGHIVEVQVTNDEEIDRLYEENARHIKRINELAAENEKLIDENIALENEISFKDGQIIGLNRGIKELEDKVDELQAALNAKKLTKKEKVQAMFDSVEDIEFDVKGGDAVKAPSKLDLLKKIKKAPEFTLEQAVKEQTEKIAREAEEKELAKANFPEYTLEYEQITFDETIDSRTMFGVRGTITFDNASYPFEATNNHHMPIVYGCMDKEVVQLTKDIIMHEIEKFSFMNEEENNAANYDHASDAEHALVVWRLTDDKGNVNYHGYTNKYILTWDKDKFAKHPGRKMIKNAFSDKPNMWKRVPNEQLADKFMAVCRELYAADFTNDDNDPEPTKAVIRITKEQSQPTNAIVYNGPMDNIGKPMNNSNDEDFTLEADDLDL